MSPNIIFERVFTIILRFVLYYQIISNAAVPPLLVPDLRTNIPNMPNTIRSAILVAYSDRTDADAPTHTRGTGTRSEADSLLFGNYLCLSSRNS